MLKTLAIFWSIVTGGFLFFTSASDNFTRADDSSGLGANWTCSSDGNTRFNVESNTARSSGLSSQNTVWCRRTAETWSGSQQHSEATLARASNSTIPGVTVFYTGTTHANGTGYFLGRRHTGGGDEVLDLYRYDGNESYTQIGTDIGTGILDTDVIGLTGNATTLTVIVNGSTIDTESSGGNYTTGTPGIMAYDPAVHSAIVTNWAASDNGGGGGGGSIIPASILNPKCCELFNVKR